MGRTQVAVVSVVLVIGSASTAWNQDRPPAAPEVVNTPTVTVLRGLTVPEFELEMQLMSSALGVSCGHCHVRGNFASDANPRKADARRMVEMTRAINRQYFPDYVPEPEESRLGRVTCLTCHQGEERPQ